MYFQQGVIETIQGESSITTLLASNKPWTGTGSASNANSVIPAGKASADTKRPFITVDDGLESRLGGGTLGACWIRVYDDLNSTGFDMKRIAELIFDTLHDKVIEYVEGETVERYQLLFSVGQRIREDEALSLNFKEVEYSVTRV